MKKDSAARAKSDLLGKPRAHAPLRHWTDAGQLTPAPAPLGRCLCADRLPPGFSDVDALRRALSVHSHLLPGKPGARCRDLGSRCEAQSTSEGPLWVTCSLQSFGFLSVRQR